MPRSTLSVAIITLNEADNLARTLASVRFADEIVVVDSGSTDRTVEIASRSARRSSPRRGRDSRSRKTPRSTNASGTWVLSLDADEELTDELQAEISSMLEADVRITPQVDGYRLRLRHVFLGRWMRYGGYYPDMKLRLFRRVTGSGPAHFTDRPVHESVTVTGRVETMEKDFLHHGYPNLEIYLEHMNRYSTLGGRIVAAEGKDQPVMAGVCVECGSGPEADIRLELYLSSGIPRRTRRLLLHLYHSAYISWNTRRHGRWRREGKKQ